MLPSGVLPALLPVVQALDALQIPYAVGGSVASSLWGLARSTRDADVVADVRLEHVESLVAALGSAYYIDADAVREAIRYRRSFNVIHLDTMFKVDVFVQQLRPFDQSVMARARVVLIDPETAATIRLTSPEDIILHKLLWYRMLGESSERQWTDILEVFQVQGPNLDRAYLHEWAGRLRVADLLGEAETAAERPARPFDPPLAEE